MALKSCQDRQGHPLSVRNWQGFDSARGGAGCRRPDSPLRVWCVFISRLRVRRFCLTLSHQYIDQLSLPVRQAIFGNVGTLIAFRIGSTDAEVLTKEFGKQIEPRQFVDLNRYEILVNLLESGSNRTPFRAKTIEPVQYPFGRKENLIAGSRERFAAPRKLVEDKLSRWMVNQT